jgi:exodeoxyribonuclease VII small subunit
MANDKGTFEEQLAELEKVVDKLERGDLTLEENVSLFERGVTLSNACKKALASAESRIQVLLDPKETGPVRVADLDVETNDDEIEADEAEE